MPCFVSHANHQEHDSGDFFVTAFAELIVFWWMAGGRIAVVPLTNRLNAGAHTRSVCDDALVSIADHQTLRELARVHVPRAR